MPPADLNQLKSKRVIIPRRKGYELRKTAIFDLDETLVHCCNPNEISEVSIEIVLPDGNKCVAGVNIRPHAIECLTQVNKYYEIFIFTASHSCYADKICDMLDPTHQLIHKRFYREHCIHTNGMFIKDLRIFKNRNIKDMIIVENSIQSVPYQLDNCIPIISWYNDYQDTELLKISKYLRALVDVEDIRVNNRKHFNLSGY